MLTAIEKGDIKTAEAELSAFASAADKAAKTNVIHKNAANRLKSRLSLQISAKAKAATAVAAK
ncbi:MAG: ribosomal protein [Verrucomicrobiaceae bacterium]|nr:ribosomal protein [Verrucomicrobiaceae bacterium]